MTLPIDLSAHEINVPTVIRNAAPGRLYEDAVSREHAAIMESGAIAIRSGAKTGRSPAALHWTKAAPPERGHRLLEPTLVKAISNDETTIGEVLRDAGYATAHYGKWHIEGGGPERHGYDESDGDTGNEQASRFTDPNPVDIFGMAARADAFMARNARAGRPFFIQLSWNALHAAENALAATRARIEERLGGLLASRPA